MLTIAVSSHQVSNPAFNPINEEMDRLEMLGEENMRLLVFMHAWIRGQQMGGLNETELLRIVQEGIERVRYYNDFDYFNLGYVFSNIRHMR